MSDEKPAEKKLSEMYREQTLRTWPGVVKMSIDRGVVYEKEEDLKYAMNPHHAGAVFNPAGNMPLFSLEKSGKGGPSEGNYDDIDWAMRIMRSVQNIEGTADKTIAVVMKHANPTAVAIRNSPLEAFVEAWNPDARAAYGGALALNKPVTAELLEQIYAHIKGIDKKSFMDNMVTPGYSADAHEYLMKKKNLRVFKYHTERMAQLDPFEKQKPEIKHLFDGRIIVHEPYVEAVRTPNDFECVTPRKPTELEMKDLLLEWYVVAQTRSNAINLTKDQIVFAVGTGKQERIEAIEDAIRKAENKAHYRGKTKENCMLGAVMASDGFIPNTDNIPPLKEHGVTAIIQPGGSEYDGDVIKACTDADIAMVLTKWRCFRH